jgi:hypothetical protein
MGMLGKRHLTRRKKKRGLTASSAEAYRRLNFSLLTSASRRSELAAVGAMTVLHLGVPQTVTYKR